MVRQNQGKPYSVYDNLEGNDRNEEGKQQADSRGVDAQQSEMELPKPAEQREMK